MAVAWTDDAVGGGSAGPLTVRQPVVAELAPAALPGPRRQGLRDAGAAQCRGPRRGLYGRGCRHRAALTAPFRKALPADRWASGWSSARRSTRPRRAGIGGVGLQGRRPRLHHRPRPIRCRRRLGWGAATRTVHRAAATGRELHAAAGRCWRAWRPATATMQVSYSPFRGFDPAPIAGGLSRYPYGCTEQLVSAAYPLIYAARPLDRCQAARAAGRAERQAVGRLLDRQTEDGAFGLWRPGDARGRRLARGLRHRLPGRGQGARRDRAGQRPSNRALAAMRQISRPDGFAPVAYRLNYPETWLGRARGESGRRRERMRSRASAYALYVLAKAKTGDLARLRWFHDVQMKDEPLAAGARPGRRRPGPDGRQGAGA